MGLYISLFLGSLTLRRLNYEALRVIYSRVAIARKYLGFEMGLFFSPHCGLTGSN